MNEHPPSDLMHLKGQLLAFVRRRFSLANDAEDIVQEALLRTMTARKDAPIGNLRAYVRRIAGNLAIDTLRHRSVRERISGATLDSPEALAVASGEPSAEQTIMARERTAAFAAALATLPERQRKALMLNRLEGWPYARIAEHLGCSPGTVYNDVKAAMAAVIAHAAEIER